MNRTFCAPFQCIGPWTDERIAWNRALYEAVNDYCTCGGAGPNDPEACPACLIWHALGGVPPGQLPPYVREWPRREG